ncbi:hypothetical protein Esti_001290 [Eimeria stiedai]
MGSTRVADADGFTHPTQGKRHLTQPHQRSGAFEDDAFKAMVMSNQQLPHETKAHGVSYSVSQSELLMEVMKPEQAWSQLDLVNNGAAAIAFLLRQHDQQPSGVPRHHEVPCSNSTLMLGVTNTASEKITLQFGFWCNESSGVYHSEWELCIYLGSRAASSLTSSLRVAEPASTKIITVVAVMPTFPSPVEILWQQQRKTHRKMARRAAHETVHQLMRLMPVFKQTSAFAAFPDAGISDPQVRENLFAEKNASLGLTAPSPLVDAFLLLRQEAEAVRPPQQCHQLELLQQKFQPLQQRKYLRAMQHLLYQCDDWQPQSFQQNQLRQQAQGQLRRPNVTQDSILYSALSEAIEAFLSALPEALGLFGLSTLEDEKGWQATREPKRQYTKGKRESKVCVESGGTASAGAAAAALAAALASLSGGNSSIRDSQTRHCVAEQLLYWLLKEAIGGKEPELAMSAATKTAAAGSAVAEAVWQQQYQHAESLFPQPLSKCWLPSPLDLRVNCLADYFSRKQLQHVTACGMALVLFDDKATEDLLFLLQQPTQPEEQQACVQLRLQQRLEFLVHLLPTAREGVMLCLGFSLDQYQRLQLQGPTVLSRLLQEMLRSETEQGQLLSVACLHTAGEVSSFIKVAARKKGFLSFPRDASTAAAASKDSEVFELPPCLFVVPSWQLFFALATQTLTTLVDESPVTSSPPAVEKIRYDAQFVKMGEEANYVTARRHLAELAALLDIDLLVLDSFNPLTRLALRGALPVAEGDSAIAHAAAAVADAAVGASNPWLLGLPATRVLGPHVISYLLATCLLMGIDAVALQERAAQLSLDLKEETWKKQSLDGAADAVCRRMRKTFRQLTTDCRSCCVYRVPAERGIIADVVFPDDGTIPLPSNKHLTPGLAHHTKLAILCSYWDSAFRELCAGAAAATVEPLLQWAAYQFQHLKAVVSGTVISDVLLAGDLISLICGCALNGHVVLQPPSQQDDNLRQQEFLDNISPAAKANSWAAAAATSATKTATAAPGESITRGWLRISGDLSEDVCGNNPGNIETCDIQPRVCGVRQLREFLQQQLLAVLALAEERNVVITLPAEVLLHVDFPGVLASTGESPATAKLSCVRQTSDSCASSQRSGSGTGKGLTKLAAADGFSDNMSTSEDALFRSAVKRKEKQKSVLVFCHLPQAGLLWNVLRDIQTNACVSVRSRAEKVIHAKRSSRDANAATRPYGTYASVPITAIKDVVASVGTPELLLWLGEDLSRQTHAIQQLLKAAGFFDATKAMTQSLLSPMKQVGSYVLPCQSFMSESQSILAGQRGRQAPLKLMVLTSKEPSCEESSGSDSTSSNEDFLGSKKDRNLTSSAASMPPEKPKVFLFGSIASSAQLCVAGLAQVAAFHETEPFFNLLQGRRLRDISMADYDSPDEFEDEFMHPTF